MKVNAPFIIYVLGTKLERKVKFIQTHAKLNHAEILLQLQFAIIVKAETYLEHLSKMTNK